MQLMHTLFKLILLSETLQLRLHPRLHYSHYKVRSVHYSLLNFGFILFWVLKSVSAKKLRRCYKASQDMYDAQMFVTRKVTRCASKFPRLEKNCA